MKKLYSRLISLKNTFKDRSALLFLITFFSLPLQAMQNAELDCMVKPEMYVDLSSPVDGVMEKLLVKKGDYIIKGQPLAQLEASVEITKVKLAKLQAKSYSDIKNRRTTIKICDS